MSDATAHIMLVEDSLSQATKIAAVLEQAGWKVTRADSGHAAFDAFAEQAFDLVLLDFHLPDMRGDEICRRLRRNIDSRNLPIVILTTDEGDQAELIGLNSGADAFIPKSVNSDALVLRLRSILGKVSRQSEILGSTSKSFRAPRLLAIDDSATFLERLRPELESEGYEVECALSPENGLDRVTRESFDGVIIDLKMPGMDGFEVCRRIEKLRQHLHERLITVILTSSESPADHSRAIEAGADDFVAKSSDISILKGRIRALLRRKFSEEENRRIIAEINERELEALTERAAKEAAEARAKLVEELERAADDLRRSKEELQKANQAKDQFLAILSHELRTPLTPVLAAVSMREEDMTLPAEVRAELSMIKRNIELEALLIDDLLDLTRITRGKLEIRPATVDMREIIQQAIEVCHSASPEARMPRMECRIEAECTTVWGDSARLAQVLWNLLRNAVKFTPASGQVTVHAFNDTPQTLKIEVADTGIGIDPEVLPSIFNAFEQGGRDVTRQYGGLGLGLAISKAITDLHQGTLVARSDGKNRGATFALTLPVTKVASPDLVLPASVPARGGSTPGQPALKQRAMRVLLVEDHHDTSAALQKLLGRRGHEVKTAGSLAEAIEALQSGQEFDALISDLGLPDGSGYDVLRAVQAKQPIHAIALSGFGMEQDLERSRAKGFAHHLTKPINLDELVAALGNAPGGRSSGP